MVGGQPMQKLLRNATYNADATRRAPTFPRGCARPRLCPAAGDQNSVHQKAMLVSGGNQQRVVIAKWLATRPKVRRRTDQGPRCGSEGSIGFCGILPRTEWRSC